MSLQAVLRPWHYSRYIFQQAISQLIKCLGSFLLKILNSSCGNWTTKVYWDFQSALNHCHKLFSVSSFCSWIRSTSRLVENMVMQNFSCVLRHLEIHQYLEIWVFFSRLWQIKTFDSYASNRFESLHWKQEMNSLFPYSFTYICSLKPRF